MAGRFQKARCILLVSACLAVGLPAAVSGGGMLWGLACALAAALVAVVCLHRSLRATRDALDRARHAKSEFLTNVSHELRTPLHGIHGLSELLSQQCSTAGHRQMAVAIHSSCESLMAAVDVILDYARIEKGELTLEQAPFNVRTAVQTVIGAIGPRAEAKGLTLDLEVAAAVPHVILGDARRLREVLRYLLDNAVKFTAAGAVKLQVSVGGDPRDCRSLLFRVCDTGPGIEPERARSLFTAFTQAHGASNRTHGGLGLGLTLAHRLVGLMGGSIGVESHPGGGSVFWFLLPTVLVEPEAVEGRPGAAPAEPRCGRILVVDDNPINQLVAVRAVHSLGFSGDAVASGKSALDALTSTPYELVLMDCQMPEMDGFETSSAIRSREAARSARRIPIVAMTANGSDRERCRAAGMDDYLPKPFRISDLKDILDRWLRPGATPPHLLPPVAISNCVTMQEDSATGGRSVSFPK